MKFKNYLNENTIDVNNIIEIAIFMEEYNQLDESIGDFGKRIKGFLSKAGLHASQSGPGLIQMLAKAGTTMTKFFWYAMKASTGDQEAKMKVKEIANTEIKKEQVIDFILKLDTISLHMITGPIHMIEAITGWHIGVYYKVAQKTTEKINTAIEHLKDVAKNVSGKVKQKILQYIEGIKKLAKGEL
jgi:hypothetical protein